MDHLVMLREIQRNGAVAQVNHAGELLTRIAANPNDLELKEEASALYEAYLHDPYLTKTQE
jgi:hypothetical protein